MIISVTPPQPGVVMIRGLLYKLESTPERDLDLLSLEHQLTEAKAIASLLSLEQTTNSQLDVAALLI